MEVFGFLKFRRSFSSSGSSTTTTITSSASDSMHQALEADDESSFFDLVFAAPNRRNHNDDVDDDDSCKRKSLVVEDASKNLSPISLLRSPQKFKVMILGFKKSKLEKTEMNSEAKEFPISSLFSRDTSLKSQLNNERYESSSSSSSSSFSSTSYRSKQFSKQVVQKYVNLIKPLYVRVSKHYNTKKKFREVCKSLVKSRSTSSSAGIVPVPINRRDDSVQQQQDGIQSAILYCKRSYSSSSSSSKYEDCSMLSRSVSSCSSVHLQRLINEDDKRTSI